MPGRETLLAAIVVIACCTRPAAVGDVLLVANRSSHEVSFVDVDAGRVVARVATGAGPHLLSNVAGGIVATTGYGEFPEPHALPAASRPPFLTELNSRLTVIDVAERRAILDVVLDECRRPHASWLVADRVFVTCEDEREILVVALSDGRELERLDTGQAGAHVLSYDPASDTLGVSNTGSGSVTLFGLGAGTRRIVPLRAGSEGALASGGRFWIANGGDGSVSVVDPASGSAVARADDLCGFPIALAADDQGLVWVACFASAELVALDTETLEVRRRLELDGHPLNLLLAPDALHAWLSLPRENVVAEVELSSGDVLRRVRVGIEPDGLRWAEPATQSMPGSSPGAAASASAPAASSSSREP